MSNSKEDLLCVHAATLMLTVAAAVTTSHHHPTTLHILPPIFWSIQHLLISLGTDDMAVVHHNAHAVDCFDTVGSHSTILLSQQVTRIPFMFGHDGLRVRSCVVSRCAKNLFASGFLFHCVNLTRLVIPDEIEELPSSFISQCSSLRSFQIPRACKRIGGMFAAECSALEHITIPKNCYQLGVEFAHLCTSLTSITFEEEDEGSPNLTIGGSFAESCFALKTLILPRRCQSIGSRFVHRCRSLTTLSLNDTLVRAVPTSFANECTSLTHLVIPQECDTIGSNFVNACSALVTIELPESFRLRSRPSHGFALGCPALSCLRTLSREVRQAEADENGTMEYLVNERASSSQEETDTHVVPFADVSAAVAFLCAP